MPLEEIVDTLEGIDETYHDLYVENADGKFEINITGLKSALTKERSARKLLEKQMNTNEDDPPDVEELKGMLKQAEDKITNMKMNSALKRAALTAGVDADYVDDVITLTRAQFNLDSDGNVINVGADGEPTGKTVDNFFKSDFKRSKPRFYSSSGKRGSGMEHNMNNGNPMSYEGQVQKAVQNKDVAALVSLKQSKLKK